MIDTKTTDNKININEWQKVTYSKKSKNKSPTNANKSGVGNKLQKVTTKPTTNAANNNTKPTTRTIKAVIRPKKALAEAKPTVINRTTREIQNPKHLGPLNATLSGKTPSPAIVGNADRTQPKQQHQPPQQQQSAQSQHNYKLFQQRRRANQQEIRQIKRAHRHLLTSGGNDWQAGATTVSKQNKSPKLNICVRAGPKPNCQRNICEKSNRGGTSKGNSNRHQQHPHASHSQQQKGKQQKKQKPQTVHSNDSAISSRWCSIEEQLDLLDRLLYYCDDDVALPLYHWGSIDCDHLNYESVCSAMSDSTTTLSDDVHSTSSTTSGAGGSGLSALSSPLVPSALKRRGHQHHPRFAGTRRPNVPNVQQILAALYRGDSQGVLSNIRGEATSSSASLTPHDGSDLDTMSTMDDSFSQFTDEPEEDVDTDAITKFSLDLPLTTSSTTNITDSVTNSLGSNSPTPTDDSSTATTNNTATTADANDSGIVAVIKSGKTRTKRDKAERAEKKKKRSKKDAAAAASAAAAVMAVSNNENNDDEETEWAKLRCTSEASEVVAERARRCSDYPGLAFRSIFSSDTMMKFNIIRNELHNIMNTQLKRVCMDVGWSDNESTITTHPNLREIITY